MQPHVPQSVKLAVVLGLLTAEGRAFWWCSFENSKEILALLKLFMKADHAYSVVSELSQKTLLS